MRSKDHPPMYQDLTGSGQEIPCKENVLENSNCGLSLTREGC